MASSCPRYFPSSPGDFSGSFNILSFQLLFRKSRFWCFIRSLGMSSIHHDLCPKTDFSYFLFPLMEEGGYFHLGVLANHLAFIFFLPPSGDSLGLLYVPVPHSLPIRSQSTNICWFPFWPGFVTSGLTYIISLNGHSLTAC